MTEGLLAPLLFLLTIAGTLAITWWAARRTSSTSDFYAAGSRISGAQNGTAISGDFMSAATFLGITGLIFANGFDGIIYIIAPLAGLGIILGLLAEPLRNLGRFTVADVLAERLRPRPARAYAAVGTLSVSLFYLIAQIVGAGGLIQVLFGISYEWAVLIVGTLMVTYVALGGMLATTWVQIVKACILTLGVTLLAVLVLIEAGFSLTALYDQAAAKHAMGAALFAPGGLVPDPLSALSLAVGLVFGMAGLPHLLIRFFTVPDGRQARRSVLVALSIITFVFVLVFFVISFGSVAYVTGDPASYENGSIVGGNNMVAVHLARVLGGPVFLGLIAAVAFATILAVVAGLTIASAGAVAHDLYAGLLRRNKTSEREEVLVSRLASVLVGVLAVALGLVFEGENIAYMIALTFSVAASANFPVLVLALNWSQLTTRGAVLGGSIGLVCAIALVVMSPAVWVNALGNAEPIIDVRNPALISMPVAFIAIWLVSMTDPAGRRASAATFEHVRRRAVLGPAAEAPCAPAE